MKRILLISLITVVGLASSFIDAYYGLLLYTWYSFASPLELTYGALEGSRLSLIVALVVLATCFIQRGRLLPKHLLVYLGLSFVFVCFSSLAWRGVYTLGTLASQIEVMAKLIFMALLAPLLVDTLPKLRWFIATIAISAGVLGAYYGVFGLFAGSQSISGPGRIGDNNGYAVLLVAVLPFIAFSFSNLEILTKAYLAKLVTTGLLVGNVVAICLTFSRGGFLALCVTSLCLFFFIRNFLLKLVAWGLIFPFMAIITWQIFSSDSNLWELPSGVESDSVVERTINQYKTRLATLRINLEQEDSAESRLHFWATAINMVRSNPALGVGLNRYPHEYAKYDSSEGKFGRVRSVHNLPLLVLSETGIFGFFFFSLTLLFSLIAQSKALTHCRDMAEDKALEIRSYVYMCRISLVGFMTGSMFVNTLNQEILWSLVSISIALELVARKIVARPDSKSSVEVSNAAIYRPKAVNS